MKKNLTLVARQLVAPGQGILAADESTGTIEKRLQAVSVPSTEETRRAYRELLFTTPGLSEFISGVILFDETLRQKTNAGIPFPEFLSRAGIIPGIKVDRGAKALANFPREKITEGLDGLRERFAEYATLGAKFAKWRAVIAIGEGIPKTFCLEANAHALARYAALAQECGLLPIVEPEVLVTGNHTIERCFEVTEATLDYLFDELFAHRVRLEEILLKASMVMAGQDCPKQAPIQQVAEATLLCLRETVPAAVPGIVFLSGGQSDELATAHLNAMNEIGHAPWELSFSFGRALQSPALKAWGGIRKTFMRRRKRCGIAPDLTAQPDLENILKPWNDLKNMQIKHRKKAIWSQFIADEEWAGYAAALQIVRKSKVEFLIGGAFGLAVYTGRWRDTKDLDLMIHPRDRNEIVQTLTEAGFSDYFEQRPYDRGWIYRATRNGFLVDVIWQMANRRAEVDDVWFTRAPELSIHGEKLASFPPRNCFGTNFT